MSIQQNINNDLKQAMLNKSKEVLSTLRMLMSAIRNKEIAERKDGVAELSDDQVMAVIKTEIKKRKDSIEAYTKGGRNELADKERSEIKILEKYLPEQMSEIEVEKIIRDEISSMGDVSMKDFGRAMGAVMPKFKGNADGTVVSVILKKVLSE